MSVDNQYITPGLDPTGYSSITGAQLLQFLAGAVPFTDKGMVVITTDVAGTPDVPTIAFKNCIWIRQLATSATAYIWQETRASDATYLKWIPIAEAAIGTGTIQGYMIKNNTITDDKIATVSVSKIVDLPDYIEGSDSIPTSDLTGTYAAPTIADDAVTTSKILDEAVTIGKIGSNSVADDMIRANADGSAEWFTPPVLFSSGAVIPGGNALKIPQVNAGATDFQMVFQNVIQRVYASTVTAYTPTQVAVGALEGDDGVDVAALKITNFIPKSATSTIEVRVHGTFLKSDNAGFVGISIIKVANTAAHGAGVAATAASSVYVDNDANKTHGVTLNHAFTSGATTGIDIYVNAFQSTAGATSSFNPSSGYTVGGTASQNAWIEVIEYL